MYTKIHFVLNRFDISPNVTALKIINIANSSVLLHNEALHVILVMHLLKLDTDIKTTNVLVDLIAYTKTYMFIMKVFYEFLTINKQMHYITKIINFIDHVSHLHLTREVHLHYNIYSQNPCNVKKKKIIDKLLP